MLSDPTVIATINREFVAYQFSITDEGWPANVPALIPWQWSQGRRLTGSFGFYGSVVSDSRGRYPLGWAGSGEPHEFETSANYDPGLYLEFLERSKKTVRLAVLAEGSSATPAFKETYLKRLMGSAIGVDTDQVDWFIRRYAPDLFSEL